MFQPDAPHHLPAAHGEVRGERHDDEGDDGGAEDGAVRRPLSLGLAGPGSCAALRASFPHHGRLLHERQQREEGDEREHRSHVEDQVEAALALAAQVVQRGRDGWPDDQSSELRRGEEPVGFAAVRLPADVGDERLSCRSERRSPHAFQQPEKNEPVGVGRAREQQERHRVHGSAEHHHGLASDDIAQPTQGRREQQRPQVVHRGDDPDEPHGAVGLLLQEDGEVRQDGAEAQPCGEVGDRDHAQLKPARALPAGRDGLLGLARGSHAAF